MLNLNQSRLASVIEQAKASVEGKKFAARWTSAIAKAESILTTSALWDMTASGVLLLCSPDSDHVYETDGRVCESVSEKREHCPAYANGFPCKHRAMHRLLMRYREAEQIETLEARESFYSEKAEPVAA